MIRTNMQNSITIRKKDDFHYVLPRKEPIEFHLDYINYSLSDIMSFISFIKENSLNISSVKTTYDDKKTVEDMMNLKYLQEYLNDNKNTAPLLVEEEFQSYPYDQAFQAIQKAIKVANHIKQRTSSPLEQLLLAHDYVSSKYYHQDDYPKIIDKDCTNFIGAMTTKSIVCMGYAKIMQRICALLDIKCYRFESVNTIYNSFRVHSFNIVHLVDEKYGIDSHFLLDATWDSTLSRVGEHSYLYFLFPIQDAAQRDSRYNKYLDCKSGQIYTYGDYLSRHLPSHKSQIVDYFTLRKALNNIYKNANRIDSSLKYSVNLAKEKEPNGENCFSSFSSLERVR